MAEKLHYTYRSSVSMSDEEIKFIKDGVAREGSFPKFVNALVKREMENDETSMLAEKLDEMKAEIIETIEKNASVDDETRAALSAIARVAANRKPDLSKKTAVRADDVKRNHAPAKSEHSAQMDTKASVVAGGMRQKQQKVKKASWADVKDDDDFFVGAVGLLSDDEESDGYIAQPARKPSATRIQQASAAGADDGMMFGASLLLSDD